MHVRLLILVGLRFLGSGPVLAGPLTPNEVRPPRGVRPCIEALPQHPITTSLTELSWQQRAEPGGVELASAGAIDCLSPGAGASGLDEGSAGPAMADGQAGIQAWDPRRAVDPATVLTPVNDAASTIEVSRSAGVTDVTP